MKQHRLLIGTLLLSALALALALQLPVGLRLDIGGQIQLQPDGAVVAPIYDQPFLSNFYDPELQPPITSTLTSYRWTTRQSTLRAPALGPGPWLVDLRLNAGRAGEPAPALQISTDSSQVQLRLGPEWRRVRLLMPRAGSDLRLTLQAEPFYPPNDPRGELGIMVDQLAVQPLGLRLWLPLKLWALLLGTLITLAVGGLLAGLRNRWLALWVLGLGVLASVALAVWRLALSTFAVNLLATALAALLVLLLLWALAWSLLRGRPELQPELWSIAGMVALGFFIRLAGTQHPHFITSDLGLNVNNLWLLSWGQQGIIFTEQLPCEAGLRFAPYPPGFYLLLLPFQLLTENRDLLLLVGGSLADAAVMGMVWSLIRLNGGSQRAALLGSALYLAPPPLLKALNVGELANVGGQAMAMGVVTLLAVRRWRLGALILLIMTALLGHLGVTASLVLLLGCWALALLLLGHGAQGRQLLAASLIAGASAALIYYSAFASWPLAPSEPIPNCPPDIPLAVRVRGLLTYLFDRWTISPPLLLALGIAGAAAARRGLPRLGPLLLGWWATTLLSVAMIFVTLQTVRWQHFVYPALAIGGGLLLALLWERGRAGRLFSAALLSYAIGYGLVFWVQHISTYLH